MPKVFAGVVTRTADKAVRFGANVREAGDHKAFITRITLPVEFWPGGRPHIGAKFVYIKEILVNFSGGGDEEAGIVKIPDPSRFSPYDQHLYRLLADPESSQLKAALDEQELREAVALRNLPGPATPTVQGIPGGAYGSPITSKPGSPPQPSGPGSLPRMVTLDELNRLG